MKWVIRQFMRMTQKKNCFWLILHQQTEGRSYYALKPQ